MAGIGQGEKWGGGGGNGSHKGIRGTTRSFVWLTVWPKGEWGRGKADLEAIEAVGDVKLQRH